MRLFIALNFNELKEKLVNLQNSIDSSAAKLKKTDAFHLTLKFLGEVSEKKEEELKERLNKIKFKPFCLTLDKLGVFPNEDYIRVIWIGIRPSEEVIKLQEGVEGSLKGLGFRKDFKFHPHITLARVKSIDNKEGLIKNLKEIKVEEKTIRVKDFRLVKSILTPKGAVYEDVQVIDY